MNSATGRLVKPLGAVFIAIGILVSLSGCLSSHEGRGQVLGGLIGGVAGNQFGSGAGKFFMTAAGAGIGALLGGAIGQSMDETSELKAEMATKQALNAGPGRAITWDNPANDNAYGNVVVTRQGRGNRGELCREFQHEVTIGGRTEQAYGTACQDNAGDWEMVSRR